MTHRYVTTLMLFGTLAPTLFAQTAAKNYESGGGKVPRLAVRAPFNPGVVDQNGHVISAVPAPREVDDEPGPFMSAKGLADKALAEQHKAARLHKTAPKLVPVTTRKANAWKMASGSAAPFVGVEDTSIEPPDVAMAVGPNQIVAAANNIVNLWDKNGVLLGSQSFASFFLPVGSYSSWFIYDPIVKWDSFLNRFWVIAAAETDSVNGSVVLIALSNSEDPSPGGWSMWATDMTYDGPTVTSNWCDYPHLGFDSDAIYLTCNQFNFPRLGANGFQYAKVRLMAKSQFLNNTCCGYFDFWKIQDSGRSSYSFGIQPAAMRLTTGSGEYLVDAQGGGGTGSTLTVWHIPNPLSQLPNLESTAVAVSSFGPAPSAQQPSSVTPIDTGDARLLFANWQYGHLSTGQNSNCGFSCAVFYELDVLNFPSISVVNDWALQGDEDYYYPSIDQNSNADKMMVYTRSSASEDAGANFASIPNSNQCTNCFGGENSLAAGTSTYDRVCCGGRNRWGDYLSAAPDPDGIGIWISGEFVQIQDQWATEIAATYMTYAPVDQPSQTSVAFGDVTLGMNAQQTVTLTNTGNTYLRPSNVLAAGTDFSESDNCIGAIIPPNGTCTITVTFQPSAPATRTGTLQVYDNTAASPLSIGLSGTGFGPLPQFSVGSLSFGEVVQGVTSAAKKVSLENNGNARMEIQGISVSGSFAQTNDCATVLNPGRRCSISVTFTPTGGGKEGGFLSVQDNAASQSQSIGVSGIGQSFTNKISPATLTMTAGQQKTATITIAAQDRFKGYLNLSCSTDRAPGLTCTPRVSTVGLNEFNGDQKVEVPMKLTTTDLIQPGSYAVQVTAVSGSLSKTAAITVTLQ